MENPKTILIFDGDCNMCNRWVKFVSRRDPLRKFEYVANQSEEGIGILKSFHKPTTHVSTMYLVENGKIFERSNAVLKILGKLKFPWNLGLGFWVVPRFIRDFFYSIVAKLRNSGKKRKDQC